MQSLINRLFAAFLLLGSLLGIVFSLACFILIVF